MRKVLIVEDDENIVELLEIHLKDLGCQIWKAYDGKIGYEMALKDNYDLIILDIMLPSMDGMDVCRQIRMNRINTPILMLTAKSEEIDKVLGLETGADDYITKPFGVREFIARVKVIFRRSESQSSPEGESQETLLSFGHLKIDLEKRKVSLFEDRVNVSKKEFDLLVLLASNPGKSYDRKKILNLVWGYDFDGYEHTVNSHINRLRSKIEPDINNPTYILTTWGVGYRFSEEIKNYG